MNLNVPSGSGERFMLALNFARWMYGLHRLPRRHEIQSHFGVSKPTACRWLRAWKDANGIA